MAYILRRVLVGVLISLALTAIHEARAQGYRAGDESVAYTRFERVNEPPGRNASGGLGYRNSVRATARIKSAAVGGTRYLTKHLPLSPASAVRMAKTAAKIGLRSNVLLAAGSAGLSWYFTDRDGDGEGEFYEDLDGNGVPDTKPTPGETCDRVYTIQSGKFPGSRLDACDLATLEAAINSSVIRGTDRQQYTNASCTPTQCTAFETYGDNDRAGFGVKRETRTHTDPDTERAEPLTNEELAERITGNPDAVQRLLNGALRDGRVLEQYQEGRDYLAKLRENIRRHEAGDPDAPFISEIENSPYYDPGAPQYRVGEIAGDTREIARNTRETADNTKTTTGTLEEIKNLLADRFQAGDTPVPDDNSGSAIDREHPTGCQLLNAVCQIRDWLFEEPPDDDVPPEDPRPTVVDLGIGDFDERNELNVEGSCPAPTTVSYLGTSFEIPFQPVCDFMTITQPFIVGGAWLVGLLIIGGRK